MVSHGAAIRVGAAARCSNVDAQYAMSNDLDNTGIVLVDGTPATGWRITSWGGRPISTGTDAELMES